MAKTEAKKVLELLEEKRKLKGCINGFLLRRYNNIFKY